MEIIRHRSVNLTASEIMEIVNGKPVPTGLSMDIGEDHIVIQPKNKVNLFGEYGPGTEYEIVYYEEDIIMKKYVVEYTDPETGATSPIDNFTAEDGYTAEQYIKDCDKNADDEWCEMLHSGTVELVEVEE